LAFPKDVLDFSIDVLKASGCKPKGFDINKCAIAILIEFINTIFRVHKIRVADIESRNDYICGMDFA